MSGSISACGRHIVDADPCTGAFDIVPSLSTYCQAPGAPRYSGWSVGKSFVVWAVTSMTTMCPFSEGSAYSLVQGASSVMFVTVHRAHSVFFEVSA